MVGREDEVHFMLPAGWRTTAGLVLSLVGVMLLYSLLDASEQIERSLASWSVTSSHHSSLPVSSPLAASAGSASTVPEHDARYPRKPDRSCGFLATLSAEKCVAGAGRTRATWAWRDAPTNTAPS
jgi:hypothetical protein